MTHMTDACGWQVSLFCTINMCDNDNNLYTLTWVIILCDCDVSEMCDF